MRKGGMRAALAVSLFVIASPAFAVEIPRDCAGAITQWKQWVERDVAIGMLTPSVRETIKGELEPIEASCAAGRNGEAMGRLTAAKRRHGYPQ
jgi:hypothetical protein